MAPITFSDFTTALAFVSILGLIMIYDQLTIMKNRLDAFHTRLTGAIRQGEAAEAEARTAIDKYNTLRKKMAALEDRLNTYHCTMLTEISGIIERQNMDIDQHRDNKHQGASSSRQLCEVPSGPSRRTTDGGVSSLNKRRPVVHSRDSCLIPHRSASTGCVGVDIRAGEPPPQQQLVVREKPCSGKNSVRSVIASMGGRSWRLKTKEKKEIVRRRMASFHL